MASFAAPAVCSLCESSWGISRAYSSSASSCLRFAPSPPPATRSVGVTRTARGSGVCVRAAKRPEGVETPKEQPRLPVSFWGFTENAEVWNSRAAMIGIFGIVIVEFFAEKGILQLIGLEIGKGLDLPL